MQLREVINQIVEKKFSAVPETQRPRLLAQALNIGEMDARRLMDAGRNQEKQFQIFMRLLPLLAELDLITVRDLHGHKPHEPHRHSGRPKAGKISVSPRK